MKKENEKHSKNIEKKPISLRKRLSRMMTFCCVTAVSIQAVILIFIMINQYVVQERDNILYVLKQDNTEISEYFHYLEEVAMAIRNDVEIQKFLKNSGYEEEAVKEQLKNTANLYSDRNRLEALEPFIENIYVFNIRGESVCGFYYPMTISDMESLQKKYELLQKKYQENNENFYCETEGKYLNLYMNLYDAHMQKTGSCLFVLNKSGLEEIYSNLEKFQYYDWWVQQDETVLMGRKNVIYLNSVDMIEHSVTNGFGLKIYARVPEFVAYRSVGTIIGTVTIGMILLAILLSYLGNKIAIYYVKPLEIIAEKIKLVGKGEFETKLGSYEIEELQNISSTFNEMTEDISRLVKEVYETQLLEQQAQIKYLQAQMDPHFLFNVLTMIKMRAAMNHDEEVREMLHNLSGLYQGKIFRKEEHFIKLAEEMEIVDFYLSLQSKRFGEKIRYAISYEGKSADFEKLMVPRLSIEPIVENAVCHGLEPKEDSGHISIHISFGESVLCVLVEDDGVGFDSNKVREEGSARGHSHVGLWNTERMIHNLCGKEYGLEIESEVGAGTKVKVLLPVRKGENYVESYDC